MTDGQNNGYHHILKYTSIFGGVQGLNVVVSLVRNKFVALILGPSGMGLVSLFNTTVNFVSQSTTLGIATSAVRHLSEFPENDYHPQIVHFVKVVRAWSLLTALLGMLVCMMLGPFLSSATFAWGDHTLHFIFLAPAVCMLAITGGETAILKGRRRLRSLAFVQVGAVLAALLISVPVYYFFGEAGIVPVIVAMTFVTMLLTINSSYRLYPLMLRGTKGILGEGMEMVRLGVAFTLAGIIGSGAEMLIRSWLNVEGDLGMLGLYNAGYMITVTYAGMVFSAMETDYFPRLSAVNTDVTATNETVNKQMEVSILMISPMLVVLIIFLPVIIPLLFSDEFLPVIAMTQVATLAMFFKALTLPVAYITLARRLSMSYLLLESFYFVVLMAAIVVGFRLWGLWGTGLAIVVAHLAENIVVTGYATWKYGYRTTSAVWRYAAIQMSIGALAYAVSVLCEGWLYWITEAALTIVSTACSLYILHQKTRLWEALMRKFKNV